MYALISHCEVAHFNALQSKDIIAPIPLHAANMLGHALGARLGKQVQGTALVVHHSQVETESLPMTSKGKGGKRIHAQLLSNKRGATAFYVDRAGNGGGYASTSRTPSAMAYQMHATASGCFSLALDFGDAQITQREIEDQLSMMRLAGGTFQSPPTVLLAQTQQELLSMVRSGYLVMDASARAQAALDSGQEPAHVFLHRHDAGYVLPVTVGYHLITEVNAHRQGIRQPAGIQVQGHAFAESVIGLVELVHVNRMKFLPATSQSPELATKASEAFDFSSLDEADGLPDSDFSEEFDPDEAGVNDAPQPLSIFWQHSWSADRTSFLIHQH